MGKYLYIFNCSCHGEETNVLCFRAFDDKNRDCWEKYEVQLTKTTLPESELVSMLDKMRSDFSRLTTNQG